MFQSHLWQIYESRSVYLVSYLYLSFHFSEMLVSR